MIYLIGIILYILFAHFISDFVMQTNEMAQNKSISNYWLTKHVIEYGKGLLIFSILFTLSNLIFFNVQFFGLRVIIYIIINMGLHWVTDYFTSRQTKKLFSQKKTHKFFIVIGFDQFIHMFCLLMTFYLIFLQ